MILQTNYVSWGCRDQWYITYKMNYFKFKIINNLSKK